MFESNGFLQKQADIDLETRAKSILNRKMTSIQKDIYETIQYGDHKKLDDIKDSCEDFNF